MRLFFGILTALFLSALVYPIAGQELALDADDIACEGQMIVDSSIDSIFVSVVCNQHDVTKENAIGYARKALDSMGFNAYTGVVEVTPFGPQGPIEAETSPSWGLIFIVPMKV